MQIGMGYFILVKEGPHFTALPVKNWYNFRPSLRYMMLMQVKDALEMRQQLDFLGDTQEPGHDAGRGRAADEFAGCTPALGRWQQARCPGCKRQGPACVLSMRVWHQV